MIHLMSVPRLLNLNFINYHAMQLSIASLVRSVTIITILAYVSACELMPIKTVTPVGSSLIEKQTEQLKQLSHWEVTGKLGFNLPDDAGSAFLDWKQHGDNYDIHLSGPLNIGAVSIDGNHDDATIIISNKTYETQSPEFLFYDTLGWPLPVRDITWWIKGLPAPSSHLAHYSENGLLKTLDQNQWNVNYISYTEQNALYLPNKIIAMREDVKLTFVLKRWSLVHSSYSEQVTGQDQRQDKGYIKTDN